MGGEKSEVKTSRERKRDRTDIRIKSGIEFLNKYLRKSQLEEEEEEEERTVKSSGEIG